MEIMRVLLPVIFSEKNSTQSASCITYIKGIFSVQRKTENALIFYNIGKGITITPMMTTVI